METDTIVLIVLAIIAVFVLYWAWRFEHEENVLVEQKPRAEDLPVEERENYLKTLACFQWTTEVTWRRNVIGAIIATFVIYLFLRKRMDVNYIDILIIAFIIVAVMMTLQMYATGHNAKHICEKATGEECPWFYDVREREAARG